jgi:hypothetical protein
MAGKIKPKEESITVWSVTELCCVMEWGEWHGNVERLLTFPHHTEKVTCNTLRWKGN